MKTRVYNPRGARADGGGLVANLTLEESEVRRWIGEPGKESAVERITMQRLISAALTTLLREITQAMDATWQEERAARQAALEAGQAEQAEEAARLTLLEVQRQATLAREAEQAADLAEQRERPEREGVTAVLHRVPSETAPNSGPTTGTPPTDPEPITGTVSVTIKHAGGTFSERT